MASPYMGRTKGVHVEEITRTGDLYRLEAIWNRLLERAATNTIFLTFEWVIAWLLAVGRHVKPLVLVARDTTGGVVGIAPLMMREAPDDDGESLTQVEFIGAPNSDYSDFIIAREHETAVVRAFLAHLLKRPRRWDRVRLREIPETSSTAWALRHLCRRPWFPGLMLPGEVCPTVVLRGREAEVRRVLAGKKYIGRSHAGALRHLAGLGPVVFRHSVSVEDAVAALPDLFRLHRQRWGASSKFHNPDYEVFYRDLVTRLLPRGEVVLSVMELNSVPAALALAFVHNKVWMLHTPVYDQEFRKLSPGMLLIHSMVTDALDRGDDEFDFTRGAEGYKQRFSNLVKGNVELLAYANPAEYLAQERGRILARTKSELAGRHPRTHRALLRIKGTLVGVKPAAV
jgi:CelD/BcsL family acetyltransferase involved in cellulose biosynthesis